MNKKIYISFTQTEHDPAISMIFKGKLYGIELERLARLKYFNIKEGDNSKIIKEYLYRGFEYLLDIVGNYEGFKIIGFFLCSNKIILDDFIYKYKVKKEYYFLEFDNFISFNHFYKINNLLEEHHFLHGLSSYFLSSFEKSAILILDSSGFDGEGAMGDITFVQSIYYGNKKDIKLIEGTVYSEEKGLYGIGTIYELISENIIGLEAGSTMGLSAYGNKSKFDKINLFTYNNGDVYFFKKNIKFKNLSSFLYNLYGISDKDYLEKKVDITKSIFADIAAHLQYEAEKAIKYLGIRAKKLTQSENICISGGVGLNVLANTILAKECGFKNIFVQSAVGDQGLSLGGLYYLYFILKENDYNDKLDFFPNIGKIYSNKYINSEFSKYLDKIKIKNLDINFIVEKLADNKIIGLFTGGSEFGPRALGFRSILASPIKKENNFKVNVVKSREKWRPLAPMILEKDYKKYLEEDLVSPYMTLSSKVKQEKIKEIEGVIHIDGTVRYQTVSKKNNELVFNILNKFKEKTGVSVLINTSLNVKGEPIVETPEEAIRLFLSTDLDYIIIGNKVLEKKKKYLEYSFDYSKNLLNVYFNDIKDKNSYIKLRFFLEKIFFSELKVNFLFFKKNVFSYLINENNIKINFKYYNLDDNYFFKYKNISYNFSGKNIKIDSDLDSILEKINKIIIKNYNKILPIFLKLKNYDN